jgi:hypothetical protein
MKACIRDFIKETLIGAREETLYELFAQEQNIIPPTYSTIGEVQNSQYPLKSSIETFASDFSITENKTFSQLTFDFI